MPENTLIEELDLDGDEPLEQDFVLSTNADQAAPDPEADPPTETADEPGKPVETDPETRAVELQFELDSLKEQNGQLQEARKFLDDAAKDPQGVLSALAKHLGTDLGTVTPTGTTGTAWKAKEDGYESDQEILDDIAANIAREKSDVLSELASLRAEIAGLKPLVEQSAQSKESAVKESATVARVLGVQKLIDIESETRNYGWKPTKEQLTDFAKKHPDILDGATDARSVAKAVVEKLRMAHFDDIVNARSAGKGKPDGSNRAVVGRSDGRGATSQYDAMRNRAGRIVHSGD